MRTRLLAVATTLGTIIGASLLAVTPAAHAGDDAGDEAALRGCAADYRLTSVWTESGHGFIADVTVTAGDTPIDGWRVTWTFTEGEEIVNSWNAEITARGPNIAAVDSGWNGQLDPGESTSFGFLGSWDSGTGAYQVECTVRS